MPPVLTKIDFVRRYEQGEFGNHSPTWNGFVDWAVAHLGGDKFKLFHIRNRVAGAMTWYNVPKYAMADAWATAVNHFPSQQLYISEMAPTELTTFQGELCYSATERPMLYYSTIRKPMRDSLLEGGRHVEGLSALVLLRRYLNPRSYGWLRWLVSAYPDHVIEFSCYSRCWGTEPGHNTAFWEVRKY